MRFAALRPGLARAFLALLLAFPLDAGAATCDSPASYHALLGCVASASPSAERARLAAAGAEAAGGKARQFLNPEFQVRNLWSNFETPVSGSYGVEAQLLFPIEIGGKRSARVSVATASGEAEIAEARVRREELLVKVATSLHRLRQLKTELFLTNEAIERFQRIISTFQKRATLTSEQRVSLTVFRYALEEEKQKKAQALAEEVSLGTDLSVAAGGPLKITEAMHPEAPVRWPALPAAGGKGSAVALAGARLAEASSQVALARADAWPTVSVGPNYERLPMRDGIEERFGLGLAFDLPVLSRNGGGKALATILEEKERLEAGQAAYAAREREASVARQYQLLTDALKSAPTAGELEKGHAEFEREFNRGLVSYSLMIEAHRQLHDTIETKHRQELAALQLLWQAQQLSGALTPEAM